MVELLAAQSVHDVRKQGCTCREVQLPIDPEQLTRSRGKSRRDKHRYLLVQLWILGILLDQKAYLNKSSNEVRVS